MFQRAAQSWAAELSVGSGWTWASWLGGHFSVVEVEPSQNDHVANTFHDLCCNGFLNSVCFTHKKWTVFQVRGLLLNYHNIHCRFNLQPPHMCTDYNQFKISWSSSQGIRASVWWDVMPLDFGRIFDGVNKC